MKYFFLAAFSLALFVPSIGAAQTTVSCDGFSPNSSALTGFGVSWNTQSSARELLLKSSCAGGAGSAATYTIGAGSATQYVYKQGFLYDTAARGWKPFTLEGTLAQGSEHWLVGTGRFVNATPPASDHFWVGYVCQFVGNSWKCGCSNAACTQSYWQLQQVKYPLVQPIATSTATTTTATTATTTTTHAGGLPFSVLYPPKPSSWTCNPSSHDFMPDYKGNSLKMGVAIKTDAEWRQAAAKLFKFCQSSIPAAPVDFNSKMMLAVMGAWTCTGADIQLQKVHEYHGTLLVEGALTGGNCQLSSFGFPVKLITLDKSSLPVEFSFGATTAVRSNPLGQCALYNKDSVSNKVQFNAESSVVLDRIAIKFHEGSDVRLRSSRFSSLCGGDVALFNQIVAREGITIQRLGGLSEAETAELYTRARAKNPSVADMNLWYILDFDRNRSYADLRRFADELKDHPLVEHITTQPKPSPAPGN